MYEIKKLVNHLDSEKLVDKTTNAFIGQNFADKSNVFAFYHIKGGGMADLNFGASPSHFRDSIFIEYIGTNNYITSQGKINGIFKYLINQKNQTTLRTIDIIQLQTESPVYIEKINQKFKFGMMVDLIYKGEK